MMKSRTNSRKKKMNTDTETTEFPHLTISLSPIHLHDIVVLLEDFVPKQESKYSLKRLLMALRQNGYESFAALETVASKQLSAQLSHLFESGLAERYTRNRNSETDSPPDAD
jgi:type VI protein secretion system component VasK